MSENRRNLEKISSHIEGIESNVIQLNLVICRRIGKEKAEEQKHKRSSTQN